MAEIEMDMDPSAAVAVGGEHDDDLIDYDDELIGQDGTDASPNVEAAAAKFGEGDVVLDSAAVDDTEYDLNGSAQDVPHGSHDQQDAGDREKPSGTDGLVDLGDQPHYDVQEQAGAQTNAGEDIHEIDFGYGEEHEVEDAQPQEQETWEENEEEGFDSHQDHDQTTELANGRHGADDAAAQDSHETVQLAITVPDQDGENAPGSDQAPAETHPDAVEEDEITWEEDDKVEEQEEAQVGQRQYTEQDPNAQDSEELGEAEAAVTEVEVENGSAAAHQESLDAGEAEFPAITVQYKGEEFSLFSLSSEGFFMELSVLDDNIETLLAGFRSELVNEIASEEELVFQVDELGLEYAEVSILDEEHCLSVN